MAQWLVLSNLQFCDYLDSSSLYMELTFEELRWVQWLVSSNFEFCDCFYSILVSYPFCYQYVHTIISLNESPRHAKIHFLSDTSSAFHYRITLFVSNPKNIKSFFS